MNYCKLYIDGQNDMRVLESMMGSSWSKFFPANYDVFYSLYKNENYSDAEKKNLISSPVKRSKFYMEVDAPDDMESDNFKRAVASLVVYLRKNLYYVAVSCTFEDYIIDKTGWNWVENDLNRESGAKN